MTTTDQTTRAREIAAGMNGNDSDMLNDLCDLPHPKCGRLDLDDPVEMACARRLVDFGAADFYMDRSIRATDLGRAVAAVLAEETDR
jgi:hypothetical protein